MLNYIGRRVLYAVFVMIGVVTVTFFIARLTGDPVRLMLPPDATIEQEEQLRAQLGMDEPLPLQFVQYMGQVFTGDLGTSLRYRAPVLDLIVERLPATLQLAGIAMLFAIAFAMVAGVAAARYRGTPAESGIMSFVLLGQSMPTFAVGMVAILVFAVGLGWFPASGAGTWGHVVLPAATLGLALMANIARLLRSAMLEVLNEDYIRTARGKGVHDRRVVTWHALRNALLPVITVIGMETGTLLGGAVVTETVFGYPGVGRLIIDSISARDFPMVQGVVIILAGVFVLANLLVDITYSVLDPRIRLE